MEKLIPLCEPGQSPDTPCAQTPEITPSDKTKTGLVNGLYQKGLELLDPVSRNALQAGPGISTSSRKAHEKAVRKFSEITARLVEEDRASSDGAFKKIQEAIKGDKRHNSWADMIQEDTLNKPREENEINLHREFEILLTELGCQKTTELMASVHMLQAKDANSVLQRVLINRMLFLLCQDSPKQTHIERYCLTNLGDTLVWLDALKTTVLPRFMALSLC